MTIHNKQGMQERTRLDAQQEARTEPIVRPVEPDFPDFGDSGDRHGCDWDESICDETATNYTHCICGDPDCESDHIQYYCDRHYALTLALRLDHLRECKGYEHDEPCEDNRVVTLMHISDFGPLAA